MNDCKKCNENSLPEKENFYIHLNMEDITDADMPTQKEFLNILKQKICMFKAIHYCYLTYL